MKARSMKYIVEAGLKERILIK